MKYATPFAAACVCLGFASTLLGQSTFTSLGFFPPESADASSARDVSDDGAVVVGNSERGFRWTADGSAWSWDNAVAMSVHGIYHVGFDFSPDQLAYRASPRAAKDSIPNPGIRERREISDAGHADSPRERGHHGDRAESQRPVLDQPAIHCAVRRTLPSGALHARTHTPRSTQLVDLVKFQWDVPGGWVKRRRR